MDVEEDDNQDYDISLQTIDLTGDSFTSLRSSHNFGSITQPAHDADSYVLDVRPEKQYSPVIPAEQQTLHKSDMEVDSSAIKGKTDASNILAGDAMSDNRFDVRKDAVLEISPPRQSRRSSKGKRIPYTPGGTEHIRRVRHESKSWRELEADGENNLN